MSHSTPYKTVLDTLLSYPHTFLSPPTSPHKLHIPQSSSSSLPTISSLSLHPVLESILHILNLDLPAAHFLCRHAEVAPKWESMYVHGMLHRVEGDLENTRAWYGNVAESEVFRSVWGNEQDGMRNRNGDGDDEEVPRIARLGWEVFLERLEGYRDRTKKRREMKAKERIERSESGGSRGATRTSSESRSVRGSSGDAPDSASTSATQDFNSSQKDTHEACEVTDWDEEERLLAETSLWEILRVLRFCEKKFGTSSLDVQDAKKEFLGRIESGDERLAKIAEGMVTGGEGWRVW